MVPRLNICDARCVACTPSRPHIGHEGIVEPAPCLCQGSRESCSRPGGGIFACVRDPIGIHRVGSIGDPPPPTFRDCARFCSISARRRFDIETLGCGASAVGDLVFGSCRRLKRRCAAPGYRACSSATVHRRTDYFRNPRTSSAISLRIGGGSSMGLSPRADAVSFRQSLCQHGDGVSRMRRRRIGRTNVRGSRLARPTQSTSQSSHVVLGFGSAVTEFMGPRKRVAPQAKAAL